MVAEVVEDMEGFEGPDVIALAEGETFRQLKLSEDKVKKMVQQAGVITYHWVGSQNNWIPLVDYYHPEAEYQAPFL
jgi:hypothetical protein